MGKMYIVTHHEPVLPHTTVVVEAWHVLSMNEGAIDGSHGQYYNRLSRSDCLLRAHLMSQSSRYVQICRACFGDCVRKSDQAPTTRMATSQHRVENLSLICSQTKTNNTRNVWYLRKGGQSGISWRAVTKINK